MLNALKDKEAKLKIKSETNILFYNMLSQCIFISYRCMRCHWFFLSSLLSSLLNYTQRLSVCLYHYLVVCTPIPEVQ